MNITKGLTTIHFPTILQLNDSVSVIFNTYKYREIFIGREEKMK